MGGSELNFGPANRSDAAPAFPPVHHHAPYPLAEIPPLGWRDVSIGSVQHPTYVTLSGSTALPQSIPRALQTHALISSLQRCLHQSKTGAKNLTRGILPLFDTWPGMLGKKLSAGVTPAHEVKAPEESPGQVATQQLH